MKWQIESIMRTFSLFFGVDWRWFCARRTLCWPPEFTKTVRNDSLLERFSQTLNGRFPWFRSNSHPSVQNRSTLQLIYHKGQGGSGNWPECSTEFTSMLEFCLQGSSKQESPWLVPLQGRKMPGNEWKFVIHLFCWKMHCYYKIL